MEIIMRSLWLALGLSLCASAAEAQVQQGSFKLSIDTDVLSFISQTEKSSDADYEDTRSAFTVGPGGSGISGGLPGVVALAFGYVAHPHLIPQLHFAFANGTASISGEEDGDSYDEDGPSRSQLMFRPELEIPFNPDGRVVGYGLVGFDLRHIGIAQEEDFGDGTAESNFSFTGYGPVIGAGLHIFLGDGMASVDLGAQFSYLVFSQNADVDGEDIDFGDTELNAKMFSITAGLSLWP